MSQTGVLQSVTPNPNVGNSANPTNDITDWVVSYTYQLDAGGIGQARVIVGNGVNAQIGPWVSPNSTVTVVPNPPGTTNPVILSCPPLVQAATFGLPLK